MTSSFNFTLPDKMPNSINFQISFTVNSEQSEPMLNVEHSTVNVQEVINLQDDSSDLNVEPLKSEDPISLVVRQRNEQFRKRSKLVEL